jgi:hypothetical protein
MAARNALLAGLFAFTVWGQTSSQVFYFSHTDSPQAMQEVTNAVRFIGEISDATLDVAKRSLTVKGTTEQIAMAGWLTAGLDIAPGAAAPREMPFSNVRAPLAQIYYLSNVDDPRTMQEFVNVVRSVADMPWLVAVNQPRVIVMRGTQEQVKAADWMLGALDQPAAAQSAGAPQVYRLAAAAWDPRGGLVVQVATLKHIETEQGIQQITNLTRSIADIQRCFPIFLGKRLVMRGSDDQIALANWLMKELDSAGGQGTQEFKPGGAGNQVVQVAYVNTANPQSLQETVNAIRSETKIQRVYPFVSLSAIAMLGTAGQLAQAQQVIQSRQGQ